MRKKRENRRRKRAFFCLSCSFFVSFLLYLFTCVNVFDANENILVFHCIHLTVLQWCCFILFPLFCSLFSYVVTVFICFSFHISKALSGVQSSGYEYTHNTHFSVCVYCALWSQQVLTSSFFVFVIFLFHFCLRFLVRCGVLFVEKWEGGDWGGGRREWKRVDIFVGTHRSSIFVAKWCGFSGNTIICKNEFCVHRKLCFWKIFH